MRPTTLISLIYSPVGIIAYVLAIIAIIALRKKYFPISFRVIYLISAAVNLATHINTWIMYRLRFEQAFFFYYQMMMQPENELIKDTQQFLISYFYFAQNICACLLTFNRYTAICHTTRHEMIWRYHVPINAIAHIITWGICMATRWPAKADFVFNLSLQIYDSVSVSSVRPLMVAMICFGAVTLFLCSIMSIRSLQRLRHSQHSKSDRNLTIIALIVFSAQAANIIVVITNAIFVFNRHQAALTLLSDIIPFLSDLFSLGPAVYTLLLSSVIRKYYYRMSTKIFSKLF